MHCFVVYDVMLHFLDISHKLSLQEILSKHLCSSALDNTLPERHLVGLFLLKKHARSITISVYFGNK